MIDPLHCTARLPRALAVGLAAAAGVAVALTAGASAALASGTVDCSSA